MAAWPNTPYGYYSHPTVFYPPTNPHPGWGQPGASPNTFYSALPPSPSAQSYGTYSPYSQAGDTYRSQKYPNLNPTLAIDSTTVHYDVRKRPKEGIPSAVYKAQRHVQATANPTSHMRLYSKSFPWTVEISTPMGTMITCEIVWSAINQALAQPIVDSEWGLIMDNKRQRDIVKKAAKDREVVDGDPWLKRIDWLGGTTTFKGLEKDEDFIRHRLLPGTQECTETWMMKFSSS